MQDSASDTSTAATIEERILRLINSPYLCDSARKRLLADNFDLFSFTTPKNAFPIAGAKD